MAKININTGKRRHITLLLTVLFTGMTLHAGQTAASVLEPRFEKAKSFAQVYTFTAQFGDTVFIQMQFTLTNLGISSENGASKILLLDKRTAPQCWNRKYVRKDWSYRKESPQSLRIGSNQIEIQTGRTLISTEENDIKVHVTFNSVPDPVIPPNTDYNAGNSFFEFAVLVPWTRVHAVIEQPGKPPKQLDGCGMLETSRSNVFPTDFCRGWITFRGYGAENRFVAVLRLPKGDALPANGWVWKDAEKAPRAANKFPVAFEGSKKDRSGFVVRLVTSPDNSFTIETRNLLYRFSFIDELGPVLGAVVKLVIGDLAFYYYEATAHLAGSSAPVPGVMECMRIE